MSAVPTYLTELARQVVTRLLAEEAYSKSCVMALLPANYSDFLDKWSRTQIADKHLHFDEEGGLGREAEHHVTVLYGLTEPRPSQDLLKVLRATPPFTMRFGSVSLFTTNPDYDVVKVGVVDSPELHALNLSLRTQCPYENDYPEYQPHVTLAYVKKGTCDRLAGMNPWSNPDLEPKVLVRSVVFAGAGDEDDPQRVYRTLGLNRALESLARRALARF